MSAKIPPWLEEQINTYRQTQGNLNNIMSQIQQIEMERVDAERAIDELQKASDEDTVYRQTGPILVRGDRKAITDDLDEVIQLAKTRITIMDKQKDKLATTLKEQEAKINEALRGGAANPV